jgi:glycosyltransferase involved in cell wall biosynthesis
MKKVSVIIPAYNKADFTIRTVESVLKQTYRNIEIIVIDDGSTDNTKEKLKCFGGKIKYIYKENGGACSARNLGIEQSSGEYIALLDCDDIYYPKKIERSVLCLESDPDYGFISTDSYFIDENDNIVSIWPGPQQPPSGWIFSRILIDNLICNSTVLVKKACFQKVGYFDEKIFICADYDMWLRLAEIFKAGYVSEKLTGYRISDNYTFSNIEQSLEEAIYLIKKKIKKGYIQSTAIQNRIYSRIYYSHAIYFGASGKSEKAAEYFLKAAKSSVFNQKMPFIIAGLALSYIWPQKLHKVLKKKISFPGKKQKNRLVRIIYNMWKTRC